MGLAYENLDEATRRFMIEEIDFDVERGSVYVSNYLNDRGAESWIDILKTAASQGNDDTLATALRQNNYLKSHVERRKPKGGFSTVAVPYTAHETLGEGEFNRYFARGLCRRAMTEGIASLEVYRAKQVAEPRAASQAKIGQMVNPGDILNDLRSTQGVEPALGLPPGPNSGLTLRLQR